MQSLTTAVTYAGHVIVESSRREVIDAVERIAALLEDNEGFLADDLIVREEGGDFHCAVATAPGIPDRTLVSYSPELTVPMGAIEWSEDPDVLEPVAGTQDLTLVQRALLDQWLELINATGKLQLIRARLPRFAVSSWDLRHHLANAGFPALRTLHAPESAKSIMVSWHSGSHVGGLDGPAEPATERPRSPVAPNFGDRLIPIKHFVNHHPAGATQIPIPGRTAVVTSSRSDVEGTYENYGDLDALQLLVSFGFVDHNAPLVHSVPVSVDVPDWGIVTVEWRAPRENVGARDTPIVTPNEEGFAIRHLTARPDNRARIATLLGMVGQAARGMSADAAAQRAEQLIDALAQANVEYYERLDQLVVNAQSRIPAADQLAPSILADIAAVSVLQRQRLDRFWS